MSLFAWTQRSTPEALRIVRSVIQSRNGPISTQDIYKLAIKQSPQTKVKPPKPEVNYTRSGRRKQDPPYPPNATHPIRSINYLKNIVLPTLMGKKSIEKFHTKVKLSSEEIEHRLATVTKSRRKAKALEMSSSSVDTWLWRISQPKPKPPPLPKARKVFGTEVGVGGDWSHLNKRRQRARQEKVQKDVRFLRELERIRVRAARDAVQPAREASILSTVEPNRPPNVQPNV